MPSQGEMEVPLLQALHSFGGKALAQDVYKALTKLFPQLTEADLLEALPSGGNKWTNRIQWVRQHLVGTGEMASAGHGVWAITEKGIARLKTGAAPASVGTSSFGASNSEAGVAPILSQLSSAPDTQANLEDIADDYLSSFKQKVLNKLQDLTPAQFEQFAGSLLRGYGFQKITVTGKSGDGGIDGHGQLRVGLATIKAAFQCKRWQQAVGPKEVQAFRGAIQGQFEQGYFFTTSTFTKAAQGESIKMGAAPVVLFEGEQVVEIMIEKGVGIRRRPVEVYEDQIEQLFET